MSFQCVPGNHCAINVVVDESNGKGGCQNSQGSRRQFIASSSLRSWCRFLARVKIRNASVHVAIRVVSRGQEQLPGGSAAFSEAAGPV